MTEATPACIAGYDPVALSARHDGWTDLRQYRFLFALVETGRVSVACREAGMSRQSAYRLRADPRAVDFARAWDDAQGHASIARAGPEPDPHAMSDRSLATLLRLLRPMRDGYP
jgi:hypothetical protein